MYCARYWSALDSTDNQRWSATSISAGVEQTVIVAQGLALVPGIAHQAILSTPIIALFIITTVAYPLCTYYLFLKVKN